MKDYEAFEQFMLDMFEDEAGWNEGWNRSEMLDAFLAGAHYVVDNMQTDSNTVENQP